MSNDLVQPFARMTGNHKLLHVERRHGATGLMRPEDWEAWHEAAHLAELAHEHERAGNPHRQALDTPTPTDARETAELGSSVPYRCGNGPRTASRPTPTPEQAAAAWGSDLRNPTFVRDSRGTTVIVDESDYNGGFEMV